jgi:hypothetical protein
LDTETFLNNILDAKEGALSASEEAVRSAKAAQDSAAVIQEIMRESEEKLEGCSQQAQQEIVEAGQTVKDEVQKLCGAAEFSAQQAQHYAQQTVAKCIGEVFYSQSSLSEDNPGAFPLFTGETIPSADTLYPDFYSWVESHAELQSTAEAYEEALATYGECAKYVISQGALRLPKLSHFIKMANLEEGIKQSHAGLPNITGSLRTPSANASDSAGAFHLKTSIVGDGLSGLSNGSLKWNVFSDFDASRSSEVYGKSDTVTPAHTTLYPWVVAYCAGKEMHSAQAAYWLACLDEKATSSLENLSIEGEKKAVSLSMPSSQFEGLALAQSGSCYVAPESGYFQLTKQAEAAGEYIRIQNNTACGIASGMSAGAEEMLLSAYIPVQKGDEVCVYYNATGITHCFRFVYARGSRIV